MLRWLLRLLTAGSFPIALTLSAAEHTLDVIALKYRTAEEVVPLVQPFVTQRGGRIAGAGNQLIVNALPSDIAEIRKIVSAIDSPPRQLVITVKTEDSSTRARSEAEVSADIGRRNARVIAPESRRSDRGVIIEGRDRDNSIRARALRDESAAVGENMQQLMVLEGNSAFISSGKTVPVQHRTIVDTPHGPQVVDSVQHQSVATGFYVLPRVSGDRVILHIDPKRETLTQHGVDAQRLATQIVTRLGEWVQIGSFSEERSSERSGIVSRDSSASERSSTIWLKVDEAP
jgi:type II secretory pathway component HofQ